MGIALRRCADAPYMRRLQYLLPWPKLSIERDTALHVVVPHPTHFCRITDNSEVVPIKMDSFPSDGLKYVRHELGLPLRSDSCNVIRGFALIEASDPHSKIHPSGLVF